jgi:ubiquinone/menaquinone biosynthesis C-methylase UbiE
MKLERKSKVYFRNAATKDTWADDSKWPKAARTLALSMDMMQPHSKVCLSLGCGLGRFLRAYIRRNAKLVIGADINVHNLVICKETGANLVRCDLESLPIRESSIEAMECCATVEHLPHPEKLMKEICRVSATNAISFVTWVSYDWSKAFTDPEVRDRMLLYARDTLFDLLPTAITQRMDHLQVPCAGGYGIFHNKGFSFSEVSKIYDAASMQITWSKRFSDANHIAVTATPVKKSRGQIPDTSY